MDKNNRCVCPRCKHRFTAKYKIHQPNLNDGWVVQDTTGINFKIGAKNVDSNYTDNRQT